MLSDKDLVRAYTLYKEGYSPGCGYTLKDWFIARDTVLSNIVRAEKLAKKLAGGSK